MKFVFVILAVIACASASIIPLGTQSLTVSQPLWGAHGWGGPAAAWAAPPVWAPAASWAASAPAWDLPAEGQYLAANRGSVHVAPLPGHAQSVSSFNLQPAPGTW